MITFLSSPKPFAGVAKTNQINAIRSWLSVAQDVEIILYGKSEGTIDTARELGIQCVPGIQTNEFGTPLFGAIAAHAATHASHDYQVYVNCDIILTPEITNAIQLINYPQFLLIGQRLDLAQGATWDISEPDWRKQLLRLFQAEQITLHIPQGSDYFGFRRGLWEGLPPIAIGRGGYDNALILFCIENHIPVIDTTFVVPVIHQFHNYKHLSNGYNEVFNGEEAKMNLSYAGKHLIPILVDAKWCMNRKGIFRNFARGDWLRALECYSRFVLHKEWLGLICRQIRRLLIRFHLSSQNEIAIDHLIAAYLRREDSI
jgi:hypothetical protein